MWYSEKRELTSTEAAKITLAKQLAEKQRDDALEARAKVTARKVARNVIKEAASKGYSSAAMSVSDSYCGKSYDLRKRVEEYIRDYLAKIGYTIEEPDRHERMYTNANFRISWKNKVQEVENQL